LVVGHGETVSPDRDAIGFELGCPDQLLVPARTSDRTDVGARSPALRLREHDHTAFGAGVDVPFRLVVNRSNKVSVALHIDPDCGSTRATARRTSDAVSGRA